MAISDNITNIEKFQNILRLLMRVVVCLALISLILEYGFYVSEKTIFWLHRLDMLIIGVFILELITRTIKNWGDSDFWRSNAIEFVLILLFGLQFIFLKRILHIPFFADLLKSVNLFSVTKLYIIIIQIYLLVLLFVRAIHSHKTIALLKMTPAQLLVSSYILMIILGTFLLSLPRSHGMSDPVPFLDRLFTSTSAVCVTGLITVDTASAWSNEGKVIIMALFQIGGLGIMTFTATFALLLGQGLGMRERAVMQDMLNIESLGKIGRLLGVIVGVTFLAEFLGTILLFMCWNGQMGGPKALWYSVFHSISAFCNAGFSLFSKSLMDYSSDWCIIFIISILIVLGGLGFTVLLEISHIMNSKRKGKRIRFSVQSKVVFWTTFILIVAGTLWILIFEKAGILDAGFQSVTTRTAGFNSVDISEYTTATKLMMMILMIIGASPGSTGGGMKTVTLALIVFSIWNLWRGRSETEIGYRKIPTNIIRNAFLIAILYISVLIVCTLALTVTESCSLEEILFEEISAVGTVGLSLGLTPNLSVMGKYIIIFSMLIGRIGPLTFLLALGRRSVTSKYSYPGENVMLG